MLLTFFVLGIITELLVAKVAVKSSWKIREVALLLESVCLIRPRLGLLNLFLET